MAEGREEGIAGMLVTQEDPLSLKDTSSLSGSDLLVGAEALRQAFVRIQELRAKGLPEEVSA